MRRNELGSAIERNLRRMEMLMDRSPFAAMAAGIVLGFSAIGGGLMAFLVVLYLLVEVLH